MVEFCIFNLSRFSEKNLKTFGGTDGEDAQLVGGAGLGGLQGAGAVLGGISGALSGAAQSCN